MSRYKQQMREHQRNKIMNNSTCQHLWNFHQVFFFYSFESFSDQHHLMSFHWNLSDSKSTQVSRTLLSILAYLNKNTSRDYPNGMVSTRVFISTFCSPFTNTLVTVPRAPITIDITVTFMFHSFFSSLPSPGTYLSFQLPSILLCGLHGRQSAL